MPASSTARRRRGTCGIECRAESEALGGRPAALRVILLGNDAASETYVAAKTKAAREAGIRAETVRLPSGSSPEALLPEVEKTNRDEPAKCSGAKPESPNFERLPAYYPAVQTVLAGWAEFDN